MGYRWKGIGEGIQNMYTLLGLKPLPASLEAKERKSAVVQNLTQQEWFQTPQSIHILNPLANTFPTIPHLCGYVTFDIVTFRSPKKVTQVDFDFLGIMFARSFFQRTGYKISSPVSVELRRLIRNHPFLRMSSSTNFSEAVANSSKIKSASNEEKLKLYSLYKQGTIGRNRTQQPGMFDLVGTAKWDAWNSLRDMSMDDAQKNYVTLVNGLLGVKIDDGEKIYSQSSGPVLVSGVNRIRIITWNRPEKKNAMNEEVQFTLGNNDGMGHFPQKSYLFHVNKPPLPLQSQNSNAPYVPQLQIIATNFQMYVTLTKLLRDFNNDETVDIVVITGSGDYFCSGNDLGNFMSVDMNDKENEVKKWIGIIE
ncbi:Enoyl-CoA delta isomerase 2, mitochondrial [Folsomia candida]|uniref:Enoyl-CoA delta isomerase 2, mitochondrial n=1 Tax=Folsomia candida TaxID=158441 RepID=A0A226DKI3_FOLCA|nr:Enoyl-CoA delta isomerase 2, mitochondrial [Folsomia candida]